MYGLRADGERKSWNSSPSARAPGQRRPRRRPPRVPTPPTRLPGGGHHPAGQRPRPVQPGEALHHLPEPEGRKARDRQHSPAGAEKHAHARNPMSRERTMRKAALALAALWLVTAGTVSAADPPPSRGPPAATDLPANAGTISTHEK